MAVMTPEHWQRVGDLYHAALEHDARDRAAFLSEACAGDDALREEIDSLLECNTADDLLDTPADQRPAVGPAPGKLVGQRLGSYEIRALVGAGGMGEVYSAYDPRLRRNVAVKVVSEAIAADPARLRRFEREARAAAALNHPNVVAIHDIGTQDATPYIVMEYVVGDTLADQMRRGRLPIDRALEIATELADGVAAAHARGIVHRDLKPANVMLAADGRVKVLDFGLAKPVGDGSGPLSSQATTTTAIFQSVAGRLVGTPAYMSPEQLLGQAADCRSDVYSLGVVLYELFTGRRPFEGDDPMMLGLNILTQSVPSPSAIDSTIPDALSRLILRSLQRDPSARPQSAAEIKAELDRVQAGRRSRGLPLTHRARRLAAASAIGAVVLAVAAVGLSRWRTPLPVAPAARPVIAVLPMANLSGSHEKGYLSAGIADTLTTSLANVASISVVPAEAVADSIRNASDLAATARDTDANLLVQSTLQQAGDRLRINAKLLEADGTILWAGDFEAQESDLLSVERRLAESIVDALKVTVTAAERRQLALPPSSDQQSLDAYWRGLALLERTDRESNRRAVEALETAVNRDPGFALAFAALGRAYSRMNADTGSAAWMTKAVDAVSRAVALEPDQTAVRLSLAEVYRRTGRNGAAVEELTRVLAAEPANDVAHRRLGEVLAAEGRIDEALRHLQRAVELRPYYWVGYDSIGRVYYTNGRLTDAVAAFTRATELRPDDGQAHLRLGTAYQALGDRARAKAHLERSIALQPDASAYANLGFLAYVEGRHAEAAAAYESAIKLRPSRAGYHRNLGDAYTKLGRTTEARAAFERAVSLTEEALSVNPTDARVMAQLAAYEAKVGRQRDALRHINAALSVNPDNPEVLHRRAVVLALGGERQAAMDALTEAVGRGYSLELVRTDDHLASLQSMPAFQALIAPPR